MDKNIKHNILVHDKVYKSYNLKHSEIYNDFEQSRLKNLVSEIVSMLDKDELSDKLSVLDVGAGTGNLSLKFIELGCYVTASDVSRKSLELLKSISNNKNKIDLVCIDGKDLPFDDNKFDIVCTYSVLHHIPDYLHAIREMVRVAKPGALIYIDHEASESKWNPNRFLKEYNLITKQSFFEHIWKLIKTRELFSFQFIKSAFIKMFIDRKHQREGDIHIWEDDHIEWKEVRELIKNLNCKILKEVDYLMYKPKAVKVYHKYKDLCNDTKYIIFRKQ